MSNAVVRTLQLLELAERKDAAIRLIEKSARLAAPRLPPWWQWTLWLAAAITIERIRSAKA